MGSQSRSWCFGEENNFHLTRNGNVLSRMSSPKASSYTGYNIPAPIIK